MDVESCNPIKLGELYASHSILSHVFMQLSFEMLSAITYNVQVSLVILNLVNRQIDFVIDVRIC